MAVHGLFRINDQFFVQPLGVEAQAAVAVGGMLAIGFVACAQIVGVGVLAIAARRLGEGDPGRAHEAVRAGFRLASAIGAALAVASWLGSDAMADVLVPGASHAGERALLAGYLRWIGVGQLVLAQMPVLDAAFMAHRRAKISLALELTGVASNALLNALLVPRFGVEGAGIATALSRVPGMTIGLALLRRGGLDRPLTGSAPRPLFGRIARIGLPIGVSIALYSIVYQVMLALTFSRFDAAGRSALGPGFGIESMVYTTFWGVAQATGTLVGRELGAGRPEHAVWLVRLATRVNLAIGCAGGMLFVVAGRELVAVLADAPSAIDANVLYLLWMAAAQPFAAVQVCYDQCLAGAGLTRPVMVNSVAMNVVRIPLAHALAVWGGLGLAGIWLAIDLSSVGKLVWSRLLFLRAPWRDHAV